MQNANIGLVDITLTCHFEVKDAESPACQHLHFLRR